MGSGWSSLPGKSTVQKLINRAGLPLQVDSDNSTPGDVESSKAPPPSAYTASYDAPGYFTGVRSEVTIDRPPAVVYDSLASDLQLVFSPISECDDTVEEEDGCGQQRLFRIVRIPFRIAFITGNLKMRLQVDQDSRTGKIHFDSLKEGRLIKEFIADFHVCEAPDSKGEQTTVKLDTKIAAKQLPPPPFKSLVKDVMVYKIDCCMLDLLHFHEEGSGEEAVEPALEPRKSGAWARVRQSLDRRRSVDLDTAKSMKRGLSAALDDARNVKRVKSLERASSSTLGSSRRNSVTIKRPFWRSSLFG